MTDEVPVKEPTNDELIGNDFGISSRLKTGVETDDKRRDFSMRSRLDHGGDRGSIALRASMAVEELPESCVGLHEKATQELALLEENVDIKPLLELCCKALEMADFSEINDFISIVQGSESIGDVARAQYVSQIDKLILGIRGIHERGSAGIMTFGYRTMYRSLDDVEMVLEELVRDIRELKELVEISDREVEVNDLFANVLNRLDKYMFEGRVFEFDDGDLEGLVVFHGEDKGNTFERLFGSSEKGLVSEREVKTDRIVTQSLYRMMSRQMISQKIGLANQGDIETGNIFMTMDEIPKTVIIDVTDEDFFQQHAGYGVAMQCLWIDWYRLPPEQRPNVVIYTNGFSPPLFEKHQYQGFLFCSNKDELNNVLSMAKTLRVNLNKELYDPNVLAPGQKEAYNNSDLREWENRTADTYQSLRHIFRVIVERNLLAATAQFRQKHGRSSLGTVEMMLERQSNPELASFVEVLRQYRKFNGIVDPDVPLTWYEAFKMVNGSMNMNPWDFKINTCLDVGMGEGRISGMLARLGIHVMGMDISPEQLRKVKRRVIEEGKGLRGEISDADLSYPALLRLREEGLIPDEIIEDDAALEELLLTVEGDFFDLDRVLNQDLIEWESRHPNVDKYVFFNIFHFNEYAFSDPRDMFADVGFSMAMLNWHVFNEIGSPDNQKKVLEKLLNVLDLGGVLIIEIPDRKVEPYASALRRYHQEYPDEPYGTIRDKKPEGFAGSNSDELYPPRYFPDINELVLLLKSVGYEVSMDDVKTYLVQDEEQMTLKEHFIVARKSAL